MKAIILPSVSAKLGIPVLLALLALAAAPTARAVSGNWTNDAASIWSAATNWSSNPTVPGTAAGDAVALRFNITAARTVTIDTTSRTMGSLYIGDPTTAFFAYTLAASGGAGLTFNNSGSGASLVQSNTTASDVISAPLTLADNLFVTNTSTLTLSGIIGGSAGKGITKVGAGNLILSAANTFSGGVNLTAGRITLGNAAALGTTAGTFTIGGGVTLDSSVAYLVNANNNPLTLNGDFTFIGAQNLNLGTGAVSLGTTAGTTRTLTVTNNLTLGGIIANGTTATSLTKAGVGTLSLAGANTYNGGASVNAGALSYLNTAAKPATGTATVAAGATLGLGVGGTGFFSSTDVDSLFANTLAGVTMNAAANAGIDTSAGDFTYATSQTGTLGLTKLGTNTLTLSGDNSALSGPTLVAAGVLRVSAANNFSAGTLTLLGANTTAGLDLRNNASTDFSKSVLLDGLVGTSYTINVDNNGAGTGGTHSLATISQPTVVARTLTISGGNSYGLNIGNLSLDPLTGQATTIVANTKVTLLDVSNPMSGFTSGNFDTLTLSGTDTGSSVTGVIEDAVGGNLTAGGTTRVTKTGTGTWTLGNLNINAGRTTISQGTLTVSSINSVVGGTASSSLGAPTTVADATLQMGATTTTGVLNYTGPGEASDRVINLAGTTGGATLTQSGASGTLEFKSALTATGAGIKTLLLNGSTAGQGKISGAIVQNSTANTTAITKDGTGTWTLTGVNTNTGPTAVLAGTLLVNSPGSLAAGSAVTVASGATLGGNGTVSGAVTVSANGTLAPGGANIIGKLTLGGTLTLNGNFLKFDLNDPTTAGTTYDQVAITGALTMSGANFIQLNTPGGAIATGTYNLMTFAASTLSTFTFPNGTASMNIGGSTLTLNNSTTGLNLVVSGASAVINDLTWNGTGGATWDSGSFWVNGNGAAASYFNPENVTFDDSGVATAPITSAGTVAPGSVMFNNSAKNFTIAATIGGTAPVVKLGTGAVTLSGANTFNGGVTLYNGTVQVNAAETPGTSGPLGASGPITFGGGVLQFSGANAADYSSRFSTAAAQNLAVDVNGQNVTFAASLTSGGASKLTIANSTGSGSLTLTGPNTAVGNVFVNGNAAMILSGGLTASTYSSIGLNPGDNVSLWIQSTGIYNSLNNDFNIGDIANSAGTLYLSGNAQLLAKNLYVASANAAGSSASGTVYQTNGTVAVTNTTDPTFLIGGRNAASSLGNGSYNLMGGSLNVTNGGNVNIGGYGSGTLTQSGGAFNTAGFTSIARRANSVGVYNFSGGLFTNGNPATTVLVGEVGVGTLNLSGSAQLYTGGGLVVGNNAAATTMGTVNLNGGTLTTPLVRTGNATAISTFNFNGGTLAASAASAAFLTGLTADNVRNGGAVINDGGFAITIGQVLAHSALGGDNATDGGLLKLGAGTLTLTNVNTYTGNTVISNGTLFATSLGSGNVAVKNGAALGVGAGNAVATLSLGGNLTLDTSVLLFDITNNIGNADKIIVAGDLTPTGVTTITLPNTTLLANGDYPLIQVNGNLNGSAANFSATAPLTTKFYTIVYLTSPNQVVLRVTTGSATLTWLGDGAVNAWDVGTPNWTNTLTGGITPYAQLDVVTFDDTSTNQTVNLTTTLTPGAVTVNSASNYVFSGAGSLAGAGALTMSGSGSLTLATANSYTGGTTVNGGTLALSGSGTMGAAAGALTVNGGIVDLGGNSRSKGAVSITAGTIQNGTLTGTSFSAQSGTISTALAGGGGLTKTTAGILTLAGGNTYAGGTTNTAGVLILSNLTGNALSGTYEFNGAGTSTLRLGAANQIADTTVLAYNLTTAGNARLELQGFNETIGGISDTVTNGTHIVQTATDGLNNLPATLTLNVAAGPFNFSGYVRNPAGGAINSPLAITKDGPGMQTFSGAAALVSWSGPTVVSNGVLELSGASSVINSSALTINGGSVKFSNGGTRTNSIAGAGSLISGGGTVILAVDSTHSGGTLISAGTLQLGTNSTIGSVVGNITNNGTLAVNRADTLTLSGDISGTGALLKNGAGTLILSGNNSFGSGTLTFGSGTVNNGYIRLASPTALGNYTTINMPGNNAGYDGLDVLGGFTFNYNITSAGRGSATTLGYMLRNVSGNNVWNGSIVPSATGGAYAIIADAGTLTLNGALTNNINNGGTRAYSFDGVGSFIVNGVIADGTTAIPSLGGIIKTGTGTLTLTNVNTYTGTTAVNGGKLVGVSGGSCANSVMTVASAATNGVQLAAPNTQWTCGGLTYSAGTTYAEFDFTSVAPSASLAPLQINGNLTVNATVNVSVKAGAVALGTYPLITWTGTGPADLSGFGTLTLPPGTAGALSLNTSTRTISVSAGLLVPSLNYTNASGSPRKITLANLLAAGLASSQSSPAYVISLASGTSAQGGSVTTDGSQILYTPSGSPASDSFGYTVTDGTSTASGTVTITFTSANGPALTPAVDGSNHPVITFYGIPGASYHIQRATTLSPTPDWTNVQPVTASATDGSASWTDVTVTMPATVFYRLSYP